MRKERNLLMDVKSEVGAIGCSVFSERSGGLNSLPLVLSSRSFPKHGWVKSHRNRGALDCCVVVLMIAADVIDAVLSVKSVLSDDVVVDSCVIDVAV